MKIFRHIFAILLAWPLSLSAQFEPVLFGNEVLFKIEIALPDGSTTVGEITVAEPSVINGRFYRKVFFRYGFGGDSVIGYLREDTSTGELWFLRDQQGEVKVQDLNLEPGDSIPVPATWCGGQSPFAQVVSTGIVDGRWTVSFDRTFGDENFCDTLRYIEGVGPNASIFYPFSVPDASLPGEAYRLCRVRQDGALIYPAGALVDFCGLATPTDELASLLSLRTYPNPCTELLFVENAPPGAEFWLYDSQGKLAARHTDDGSGQAKVEINVQNLPPGLYWLSIRDERGHTYGRSRAVAKQ